MKKKVIMGMLAASLSLTMTGCGLNPLGEVVATIQQESEAPTVTAPDVSTTEDSAAAQQDIEPEDEEDTYTSEIDSDEDEKDDEKDDEEDSDEKDEDKKDSDEEDSDEKDEDKKDSDEEDSDEKDEDKKNEDKKDSDEEDSDKKDDKKNDKKDDKKEGSTTADASDLSDEWTDLDIILDGVKYTLPASYAELEEAGWILDLTEYGYEDGYMLNPGDKTSGSIELKNDKFDEYMRFTVGFTNVDDKVKDITECSIWCVHLDTCHGWDKLDNVTDLVLAKGIHIGSTEQDIIDAYGECEDVYVSDEYNYKKYSYNVDSIYLELHIDGEQGVTAIDLSSY